MTFDYKGRHSPNCSVLCLLLSAGKVLISKLPQSLECFLGYSFIITFIPLFIGLYPLRFQGRRGEKPTLHLHWTVQLIVVEFYCPGFENIRLPYKIANCLRDGTNYLRSIDMWWSQAFKHPYYSRVISSAPLVTIPNIQGNTHIVMNHITSWIYIIAPVPFKYDSVIT